MVTITPISQLKRVKAPKRRLTSFTRFVIESLLFSNLLTSTFATKSPEFMFSEIKELSASRRALKQKGPKLDIRLACGQRIGLQIGSAQKDL